MKINPRAEVNFMSVCSQSPRCLDSKEAYTWFSTCCCHFEILNHFLTSGPAFSFFRVP